MTGDDTRAKALYEAYCSAFMAQKTLRPKHPGQLPLASWEDQRPEIRKCWRTVAEVAPLPVGEVPGDRDLIKWAVTAAQAYSPRGLLAADKKTEKCIAAQGAAERLFARSDALDTFVALAEDSDHPDECYDQIVALVEDLKL